MKGIVVSPVVSEPALSGNSARVKEIIHILKSINVEITFVLCPTEAMHTRQQGDAMSRVYGEQYKELNGGEVCRSSVGMAILRRIKRVLKPTGSRLSNKLHDFIFKDGFINRKVQKEFENLVDHIKPDFVLVEYALLSKLILNIPRNIKTLVDTHDRFSDRNPRIRALGGRGFWLSLSPKQESDLLSRFDSVIAIQKEEGDFFTQLLREKAAEIVTLSILSPANIDIKTGHEYTNQIGFIGSSNGHNREGLELFLERHWLKIIAELPNAKLFVAGAKYPSLESWSNKNVIFAGRVDDLGQFYQQCAIVINPCITGSGLKIKSVEAMRHGKSLVTTAEGAEGLKDAADQGLFIENLHSPEFSRRCINLLNNRISAERYGENNITYINQSYRQSITLLKSMLVKH
jgi:hypothetical protein